MMQRSQWGPVASPRGRVIDQRRVAARSPKPPNAGHIRSAADIVARPVSLAEAAQAKLFESILQVELYRLQDLEKLVTLRGTRADPDELRAAAELRELSAGIEEVNHLLKALRDRFLHAGMVGAPAEQGVKSPHVTPSKPLAGIRSKIVDSTAAAVDSMV
jgi:hypothetical protein